jgi:hypothetical protein
MRFSRSWAVFCLAAAAAGWSCRGEQPAAPPPVDLGTVIALAAPSAKPVNRRPKDEGPFDADPPDPEAQRLFRSRLAEPPVALGSGPPPVITRMALENTARGEARGMRPVGAVAVVTLREGQRAEQPIKLMPGDCTTFIAEGGLGVIEVDLFVTTGPGDDFRVVAEDGRGGPIAVVGGRGKCFKNGATEPLEGAVHVSLRRGNGVVLLRSFRK